MKTLGAGDRVLVNIPLGERHIHKPIAKYHGQEMVIAKRVFHQQGMKVYYELVGAESEYGVPFGFAKDWLIRL